MRTMVKPVRLVLALTAALVVGSGVVLRDVGAQAPTVWLWKDLKGNCPATCDRNVYECPCRTQTET